MKLRSTGTLTLLAALMVGGCSSTSPSSGPVAIGIDVTPDSTYLAPGDTVHLTVTVLDSLSTPIVDAPVAYLSRHPSVATVSATGKVTALTYGRDTIVVLSGDASGTVIIDVAPKRVAVTGRPFGIAVNKIAKRISPAAAADSRPRKKEAIPMQGCIRG